MSNEDPQRTPFDEQVALEELERLRESIEGYRRQRKEVLDEFDRFTRSFRTQAVEPALPVPPPAFRGVAVEERTEVANAVSPLDRAPLEAGKSIEQPQSPPPALAVVASPTSAEAPAPFASDDDRASGPDEDSRPLFDLSQDNEPSSGVEIAQSAESPANASVLARQAGDESPADKRPRVRSAVVLGLVTVLLAAAGVIFSRSWRSAPSAPSAPAPAAAASTPSTPPPNTAVPSGPPVAATLPSAAETLGIEAELTTLRHVWVRVLIDGERTVERELQADVRLPLRAGRTITIRTGDAGAVTLVVDGRSLGPLGGGGEVVTRVFTARQPATR